MTNNNSWEGLHYCELEDCKEVAVVEVVLEDKSGGSTDEMCDELVLCEGHADFLIEKIELDDQLEYHDKSLWSVKSQRYNLIRREVMRDEASIRVPDGIDPLDVLDPDKTKNEIFIASGTGGQYWLELCESEKHAQCVSDSDDAMPNCDVLYISEHIDCEPWWCVRVSLTSLVRLNVGQDCQHIINN